VIKMSKTDLLRDVWSSTVAGLIIALSFTPILLAGCIWLIGGLQILGFDMLRWVNGIEVVGKSPFSWVTPAHEPQLIMSWWAILAVVMPTLFIAVYLVKVNKVKLRAVDAATGETGVWSLSLDRLKQLDIVNYQDEPIGVDGLHKITLSDGSTGYEADEFDPKDRTVRTSWYVGESPSSLRELKRTVYKVRDEFLRLANKGMDTTAEAETAAFRAGGREVNKSIKARERLLQQGETPNTPMQDELEDDVDKDDKDNEPIAADDTVDEGETDE